MTFVRWHYRDGVYIRSHYRHTRRPPGDAQAAMLLPAPPADRAAGPGRRDTSTDAVRSEPRRTHTVARTPPPAER